MSIKEKKALEKTLGKNVTPQMVLSIVIFTFALSWFADGIAVLMHPLPKLYSGTIMLLLSVLILAFFYYRLWTLNKKYSHSDDIDIKRQKSTPRKALVVTLSELRNIEKVEKIKSIKMTMLGCAKWDSNLRSWQMPLEAILYHLEKLESLTIITSKESDRQYDLFLFFVNLLIPERVNVSKVLIDINDLDDIKRGYHEVGNLVENYSNKEIVYDITGGKALNTMAGSYFTLNADRLVQYVDTDTYEVKMYNNNYIFDE